MIANTRTKQLAFALLLLMLAFFTGSAKAAEFKIGYFESTATITLIGPIERGDFARFKSTIQRVADDGDIVTHLYIFSSGGSVIEALRIGRLASKLALTTVAPGYDPAKPQERFCQFRESKTYTDFVDFNWTYNSFTREGERKCNCASACFLIWAAGADRQGNYLGIHRAFIRPELFKKDSFEVSRARYVRLRKRVEAYLEEMNVPNLVIDTMFSISSSEIEPLAQNFVDILQGGPELDEYLRAHCPSETKFRELSLDALNTAKQLNNNQLTKSAQETYDSANLAAYRCEIEVRKSIFKDAWAEFED